MVNNQRSLSPADLIAWLGLLAGFVSIWLYVAGWTYAYAYFDQFHLSLGMVDPSVNDLLIYGFWVLTGTWWVLPACALLLLFIICGIHWHHRLPGIIQLFLSGTLVLSAVILAHHSGERVGLTSYNEQREADYAAYPRAAIGLASDVAKSGLLPTLAATDCARLLVARPGQLILIRPRRSASALPLQTLVIPMSSIEWVRITDIHRSCE